jgi:hypothetical protein
VAISRLSRPTPSTSDSRAAIIEVEGVTVIFVSQDAGD